MRQWSFRIKKFRLRCVGTTGATAWALCASWPTPFDRGHLSHDHAFVPIAVGRVVCAWRRVEKWSIFPPKGTPFNTIIWKSRARKYPRTALQYRTCISATMGRRATGQTQMCRETIGLQYALCFDQWRVPRAKIVALRAKTMVLLHLYHFHQCSAPMGHEGIKYALQHR